MIKSFLLSICVLSSLICLAQKETDFWFYGHQAGLSFTGQSATPIYTSKLHQLEGSAVISDRLTGHLLFYTDGISIWNRDHQLMDHGKDLLGSYTSTQSALIVPVPGDPLGYYVFTVKAFNEGSDAGLHYSRVDMRLNQGLGDVLPSYKNVLLESRTTEKLTAIPHANGQDYWVLTHAWNSDEFLVFLLTPKGLSMATRITIGTVHSASRHVNDSEAMGYLKASPNSMMVASAVHGINRPFELYDFDNRTGILSNYRSLGNYSYQYGVSFSPDNSKLYLSGLYAHQGSYQFDLSTPDYSVFELVLADTLRGKPSQTFLSGALQLGIDGKLYSSGRSPRRSHATKNVMAVVSEPNKSGNACALQYLPVSYRGKTPLLGLPNFIQSVFNEREVSTKVNTVDLINVYPNPLLVNELTIELLQGDISIEGYSVYDLVGKEIVRYNQPIRPKTILDTSTWAKSSIYYCTSSNESGQKG